MCKVLTKILITQAMDQQELEISEAEENDNDNAEENSDAEQDAMEGEPLQEFKESLRSEVVNYRQKLNEHGSSLSCRLCPYRKFKQKHQLCTHVDNYHKEPFFTASATKEESSNKVLAQYHLAQGLYRQRVLTTVIKINAPFEHDLLKISAELLRQWNTGVSLGEKEVLESCNNQPFVQV